MCISKYVLYVVMTTHYDIISRQMRHDAVIKWKHFPCYGPFVRGIQWTPLDFPSQRPVTRSVGVFFALRLNKWLSKQSRRHRAHLNAGDLRRHCAHHDVTVRG